LLENKVKVLSVAVLQHSAERIRVDLKHICQCHHDKNIKQPQTQQLHDILVVQLLVDLVLARGVLWTMRVVGGRGVKSSFFA
jgi:glutaredoxin 2